MKRLLLVLFLLASPAWAADPVILYTDILSGPNNVGEDNNGTYLSIFGTGFGAIQGTSTVEINGTEVAAYKYWGLSRGRPGIQQISVQPGSSVTTGAIEVIVGGQSSNLDHTFTVASGDIYFVSLTGNDGTGVVNDITKPFRDAQNTVNLAGYGAGDTVVVRGGTWTDVGDYGKFVNFTNKSGTIANPMMIMGYPGETVTIDNGETGEDAFQIYRNDSVRQGGVAISNFRRVTDWGCLSLRKSSGSSDVPQGARFVNCECAGMHGTGSGTGNIGGGGDDIFILGNNVHTNGDDKLYHAIYMSHPNDDSEVLDQHNIEIAYNWIHDNEGGRGVQIYSGSGPSHTFNNVLIHDNLIHHQELHPITLSARVGTGNKIYNNVIYNASDGTEIGSTGAIQLNWPEINVDIYNNTIYNVVRGACFDLQELETANIHNNICLLLAGQEYTEDDEDWTVEITAADNVWYGSAASLPIWDDDPITTDPKLAAPGKYELWLQSDSPCVDGGTAVTLPLDFDTNPRPVDGDQQGGAQYDCGAYEYQTGQPEEPPGSTATGSAALGASLQ